MDSASKPGEGRKPADERSAARRAFGELLQWHLKRGTRPAGTPAVKRRPWQQAEFGHAVRGANAAGASSDRTVRNWCKGRTAPEALRPIELALFGPEPEPGSGLASDQAGPDPYMAYRQRLRLAFERAKGAVEPKPQDINYRPAASASCSDPGACFGRELEIARLATALLEDPQGNAVLVLGNGGHGKTMLMRAAAIRRDVVGRFAARRWFVELERADSAEAALAEIAQALGLERTAAWDSVRAALEDLQHPGLLLLDNLETPLHAPRQRLPMEQLLRDLAALPGLALAATLRSQETVGSVPWTELLTVEPLAPAPARAMFLSIARTIGAADPDLDFFLGEAAELGGIPLAIHLVAHRVFRQSTLAALRREWRERGALLARLPGGEDARGDSLVASVEFSLHSKRLKPAGKCLFSLLGQLPAGLNEKDAMALLGPDSREAAAQLRAVGLLRDIGDARIGLLPPIRDVAARLHPPGPELMLAWTRHFLDLLQLEGAGLGGPVGKAGLPRLIAEMPNIAAAMPAAMRIETMVEQAVGALRSLQNAMRFTGFSGEAGLENLLTACREAGHRTGQGICLFIVGDKARMRGENEAATSAFLQALQYLDGTPEYRTAGLCYWSLAEISILRGAHDACKEHYLQARSRFEQAGWLVGEADCLSGLAGIADQADDYQAALALYRQASDIFRAAGGMRSLADTIWYMAELERVREHTAQAAQWFSAAREIYLSVGHLAGEADCLRGLGQLAAMQGQFADARRLLEQARGIPRPDANSAEMDALLVLAELERRQGDPAAAQALYRRTLPYFRSADLLRGQAEALSGLGATALMRQDRTAARGFYEAALDLYRRLGGLIGPANCLSALADIAQPDDQETALRLNAQAAEAYIQAGFGAAAARCRLKQRLWAPLKRASQAE